MIQLNEMRKVEMERLPYTAPECRVFQMEAESFICTSVVPQVPGSQEEEWEEHEEEGGELEL